MFGGSSGRSILDLPDEPIYDFFTTILTEILNTRDDYSSLPNTHRFYETYHFRTILATVTSCNKPKTQLVNFWQHVIFVRGLFKDNRVGSCTPTLANPSRDGPSTNDN